MVFCEIHPDVRAYLVAPKRYQGVDYSTGNGPTHLLPFGSLNNLVDVCSTLGSLHMESRDGAFTGYTSAS